MNICVHVCLTLHGEVGGQERPLGHPLRVGRGTSVARLHGLVDVLRPLKEKQTETKTRSSRQNGGPETTKVGGTCHLCMCVPRIPLYLASYDRGSGSVNLCGATGRQNRTGSERRQVFDSTTVSRVLILGTPSHGTNQEKSGTAATLSTTRRYRPRATKPASSSETKHEAHLHLTTRNPTSLKNYRAEQQQ